MSEIKFLSLTDSDIERIKDIRDSGSVGLNQRSFRDMPQEIQNRFIERMKVAGKVIVINTEKIGWIFISPKPDLKQIDIGYALFPEFRGKGLMKSILNERISIFVENEFPAIKDKFPERELTATTEVTNIASVKTLMACGFTLAHKKMISLEPDTVSDKYEALIYKLKF